MPNDKKTLVIDVLNQTSSMWIAERYRADSGDASFSPEETQRRLECWHAIRAKVIDLMALHCFPQEF